MDNHLTAQQVYEELGSPSWLSSFIAEPPKQFLQQDFHATLDTGHREEGKFRIYVFTNIAIIAKENQNIKKPQQLIWFSDAKSPEEIEQEEAHPSPPSGEDDSHNMLRFHSVSEHSNTATFLPIFYGEIDLVTPTLRPTDKNFTVCLQFKTERSIPQTDKTFKYLIEVTQLDIHFEKESESKLFYSSYQKAYKYLVKSRRNNSIYNSVIRDFPEGGGDTATRKLRQSITRMKKQQGYFDGNPPPSGTFRSGYNNIPGLQEVSIDDSIFSVLFKRNHLGFTINNVSSSSRGPFVNDLETDGLAEYAGVIVGDEIRQVNSVKISQSTSGKKCTEIIKSQPEKLPIEILFFRSPEAEEQRKHAAMNVPSSPKENKTSKDNSKLHYESSGAVSDAEKEPPTFKPTLKAKTINLKRGSNISVASGSSVTLAKKKVGKRRRNTRRGNLQRKKESMKYKNRLHNIKDFQFYQKHKNLLENAKFDIKELFETMVKSIDSKAERTCIHALDEIYRTESVYLDQLGFLLEAKKKCLSKKRVLQCKEVKGQGIFCEHNKVRAFCSSSSKKIKHCIETRDTDILFLNIKSIIQINSKIMHDLDIGLVNLHVEMKEGKTIGVNTVLLVFCKVFRDVAPYLTMYSVYCQRYSVALNKERELRVNNSAYVEVVSTIEKMYKTNIPSLLIKPIQRLTKYPLLFSSLIKYVEKYVVEQSTSEELASDEGQETLASIIKELEGAFQIVSAVVDKVNKNVGDAENIVQMYEANAMIGGKDKYKIPDLIQPWRKYVNTYDDVIFENITNRAQSTQNGHIYVFNDLVVVSTLTRRRSISSFSKGYGTRAASKIIDAATLRRSYRAKSSTNLKLGVSSSDLDKSYGLSSQRARNSSRASFTSLTDGAKSRKSVASSGKPGAEKNENKVDYSVCSVLNIIKLANEKLTERTVKETYVETDEMDRSETSVDQFGVQFSYTSGGTEEIIFWFESENKCHQFRNTVARLRTDLQNRKERMAQAQKSIIKSGPLKKRGKKKNN